MTEAWWAGDAARAVAVVVALLVTASLEVWAWRRGLRAYFALTLDTPSVPVPLPARPPTRGRRAGIAWVPLGGDAGALAWRAHGRGLPRGLHGTVELAADPQGRVHLRVRWAPPWVPFMAAVAVAVVGAFAQEPRTGALLGAAITGSALLGYGAAVPLAVRTVRHALALALEEDPAHGRRPPF